MKVSVSRDGTELGEWSEEDVRTYFREGKLLPTDFYWKEGMSEWSTLDKFIKPPPPVSVKKSGGQMGSNTKASTQVFPQAEAATVGVAEDTKQLRDNKQQPDYSGRDEPPDELKALNAFRENNKQTKLDWIERRTSSSENYGTSNTNPILVTGLVGLAAYVRDLRFQSANSSVVATYKCTLLQSIEMRKAILDEYPMDVFDITSGRAKQSLVFCLYGAANDAIHPRGFYGFPIEPKSGNGINAYLKFPQMGYLDGITKKGVVTCAFVKHDKRQLQILLNTDKLDSCPWQELSAHCSVFSKLL